VHQIVAGSSLSSKLLQARCPTLTLLILAESWLSCSERRVELLGGIEMLTFTTRKSFPALFAIIFSLVMMVFVSPVSEAASKVSNSEYKAYMKSMNSIAGTESSILDRYGSVTGDNYTDDETMYNVLTDLTPEINLFIGKLERIQPRNSTLRSSHKSYISGWNLQFEGLLLSLEALEEQSYSTMAKANRKLSQGRAKLSNAIAKADRLGY
jgi:hypothetical protein